MNSYHIIIIIIIIINEQINVAFMTGY